MTRSDFVEFVGQMIDLYGVRSYRDNLEDGIEDEQDDLWFECPECMDSVLFDDYEDHPALRDGYCPICGANLAMHFSKENWYEDEDEEESADEDD